MKHKNSIAIIPARGGSKRIPRKNIIDFHGKPMIAWTIKAALESGLFQEVHVSTDDDEIRRISLKYGAKVPFIREDCTDDYSTVSDVIVGHLRKLPNISVEVVCLLMANCPLRTSKNILDLFSFYLLEPTASVISAFKYGFCNPWWAHKVDSFGNATPIFSGACNSRSQDLELTLCPSGAIWVSNINNLLATSTFYSKDYRFYELPLSNAVDIDDYQDLSLARALAIQYEVA